MQLKNSRWLIALAIGVVASQGEQGYAQCDGPVVVQVPKQAASIAEAVAMACPGHPLEIVLAEGTWPMAIDTQDPSIEITIRGVSNTGSIVTQVSPETALNARFGSRITFVSVTVQNTDVGDWGNHWDIAFDDCIVRNTRGNFHAWGDMAARNTSFTDCIAGWGTLYTPQADVLNCQFERCSRPIAAWCDGVVIENCIFNEYTGHAVALRGQATIRNSVFSNGLGPALVTSGGSGNCGLGNPTQPYIIENCTFTNCASGVPGGAISDRTDGNTPRSWQVVNCTFTNNTASSGGAIYFGIDRMVTLTNCVFEGNVATAGGGGAFANEFGGNANAFQAMGCQFLGNSAPFGRGGAVHLAGWAGITSIDSCTFIGNSGTEGGGVYNDRHTMSVMSCNFVANLALGVDGGGGLGMSLALNCVIAATTFEENHATRGGAVSLYNDCSVAISNCIFSSNSALERGGAISAQLRCDPVVQASEFRNNSAPNGSAISSWGSGKSGPFVSQSIFSQHNTVGPAVTILSASGLPIRAELNVFCENTNSPTSGDVQFAASNCVVVSCLDANGDGQVDACACPGDVNGNFFIDGADLSILLGYWGPVTNQNNPADLNNDGTVDGADLAVLLGGWGACP
jgi:predicted outer membrane repeat protein